jgi:hypothetical protein
MSAQNLNRGRRMSPRQDLKDAARIPGDLLDALAALRAARRAALGEAAELAGERQGLAAEAQRGDPQAGERIARAFLVYSNA